MTDRQSAAPAGLARLSGLGYLVIIVAGIFAEFFVRGGLIVPGDGPATLAAVSRIAISVATSYCCRAC